MEHAGRRTRNAAPNPEEPNELGHWSNRLSLFCRVPGDVSRSLLSAASGLYGLGGVIVRIPDVVEIVSVKAFRIITHQQVPRVASRFNREGLNRFGPSRRATLDILVQHHVLGPIESTGSADGSQGFRERKVAVSFLLCRICICEFPSNPLSPTGGLGKETPTGRKARNVSNKNQDGRPLDGFKTQFHLALQKENPFSQRCTDRVCDNFRIETP